ncbi:MAG TPA: lytic transglycosylase domain-containing protein [Acetobacteraceae bacterium]|nr:lytic transglycosylase domain-containing protein [Acetobacteraceae bacterium]
MLRLARRASLARTIGCLALLTTLAACASHGPSVSQSAETARYLARAHGNYAPPGPPNDPWGPYIHEAADRFHIPGRWIRAVMHVESGGQEYMHGQLTTSGAGAMGLMQVMPETYDELRQRYNLGDDPFNPHDNIMAGAAYLREMYDIYGSPGFLAAYNAGPGRLDDYLANNRPLPAETRHYVAMIGPEIIGVEPAQRSPAEQYAMNQLPVYIPPGKRYSHPVQLAGRREGGGGRLPAPRPIQVAQLPEPPRAVPPAPASAIALVTPPPPPPAQGGFHLIQRAVAEPIPFHHVPAASGRWAIQVGAFSSQADARKAIGLARRHAHVELAVAHSAVEMVHSGHSVLWRARLTGLSRDTAAEVCGRLTRGRMACMLLSPEGQS